MTPMNAGDNPTRSPTIGKIGNTIPPAIPANNVPGASASANDFDFIDARA
jgi:hypothetical protein